MRTITAFEHGKIGGVRSHWASAKQLNYLNVNKSEFRPDCYVGLKVWDVAASDYSMLRQNGVARQQIIISDSQMIFERSSLYGIWKPNVILNTVAVSNRKRLQFEQEELDSRALGRNRASGWFTFPVASCRWRSRTTLEQHSILTYCCWSS